ncbi:MAG: VTT domain-containing protein [Rhodobacteraceae bacterium]|nr:VTT domain-containing protein [Paracoccaceae bacterium]
MSTEWVLAAVPTYGPWLVALVTFLSCLALPVPASIVMLVAGGFAAAGDLALWQVAAAALAGAVLGDQTGFWVARLGGRPLVERLAPEGPRAVAIDRARAQLAARGIAAVFLTRWLVSPLGPYANFVTGAAGYPWVPFTAAGIAGEAVWVGLYVGAGYAFGDDLEAAAAMAGSGLGLLATGTVTLGLGWWLLGLARQNGQG